MAGHSQCQTKTRVPTGTQWAGLSSVAGQRKLASELSSPDIAVAPRWAGLLDLLTVFVYHLYQILFREGRKLLKGVLQRIFFLFQLM